MKNVFFILFIFIVGCSSTVVSPFKEKEIPNLKFSEFVLYDSDNQAKIFEGFITNCSGIEIKHLEINYNIYDSKGFRIESDNQCYALYSRVNDLTNYEVYKIDFPIYNRLVFSLKIKNYDYW